MRRIIALIVLIAVLFSFNTAAISENLVGAGIGAESGTCGNQLTWAINNGVLTISGTGKMYDYSSSGGPGWSGKKSSITSVVIQSGVTSIGDNAFNSCPNLQTVTMADTVVTVGENSFAGCTALKSVVFSKELLSIGWGAFAGCQILAEINLPSKLQTIAGSAFENNQALTKLDIPGSVTKIGSYAWYSCSSLKTVHISGNVKTIDDSAFNYCKALTEVTLDEGVEAIGPYAFWGDTALRIMHIPGSLEQVGESAFTDCSRITDIYYNGNKAAADKISIGNDNVCFTEATWHCTDGDRAGIGAESGTCGSQLTWAINNGVLTISGTGKMYDYSSSGGPGWSGKKSSITSVVIQSGVTSIGDNAFNSCPNLQTVTMADTVVTVGENSFAGCTALKSVVFSKELLSIGWGAFAGCQILAEINLPSKLQTIAGSAFENNQALTKLDIPGSVTKIGSYAWYSCSSLKTVHISGNVKTIDDSAFNYCKALTEVTLDEGVEAIGPYVFWGDTALRIMHIPGSLEQVGESAFTDCSRITDIYYNGNKAAADKISIGNDNVCFTEATWHCTDGDRAGIGAESGTCGSQLTWAINNGVLTISGTGKMYDYSSSGGPGWSGKKSSITSVVIQSGVTSIGDNAFNSCPNLQTVTMADTVVTVGENSFAGCTALKSVVFSKELLSIGWGAFAGCQILAEINLPSKLQTIAGSAFENNQALTKLDIPGSVTKIGSYAWYSCSSLKTVHISGNVKTIDDSAFNYCKALTEVTLDEGVEAIGPYAFWGDTALRIMHIPGSLEQVGESAFTDCNRITDIYYNGNKATADKISIGNDNTAFTDANWHFFSTDKIVAYVTRCYEIILGRKPDAGGLNTWVNELNSGRKAAAEIIEQFVASAEFQNKNLSNADAVEILYKAMLGRGSDPSGKADWVAKLNAGQHITAVINGFCGSAEFKAICDSYGIQPGTVTVKDGTPVTPGADNEKIKAYVERCYQIILGRGADEGGLNTWMDELTSGRKAAAEIIEQFVGSAEFQNKKLSNSDSVEILYKAMLGRGSDPAGKASWVEKLDAGQDLTAVINGFCGSAEFKAICDSYGIQPGTVTVKQPTAPAANDEKIQAFVARCYKIILGRDADEGGMNTWFNELKSGRKAAAEIIESFVNSQEFKNKNYSNADAVEILYKAMLGRGSDPAGKADWVAKLNNGQPLEAVINGFCGSAEFKAICDAYGITPGTVNVPQLSKMAVMEEVPAEKPVVKETVNNVTKVEITNASDTVNEQLGTAVQAIYINEEKAKEFIGRCYRVILGREASQDELDSWIGQMTNGSKTADQIARGFLFSGEFKGRNIGNEELVKILYRVYMNREADPEGLATWTQKLDEGTGLNDLLDVFAKTNEFKAVLKDMAQ